MPRRISQLNLNASTIDIINVIRANASYEYQNLVPKVEKSTDIPKVGEVLYGTPSLANQFINALVNRIAIVRVQSATFNNPYSNLKKGYLEFGETIEDIFVSIANVVEFDPEKAEAREFKRTFPDIKSAFHVMNWRVMYPVTIQDEDLKQAFLSMDGVQNLIAKIVDAVYTAAEYDEFLLFKYLIIKAVSHGKMYPIATDTSKSLEESAISFRGISNLLPFMSSNYNEAGVKTTTPKSRQIIFMDAMFNARFDVTILASAFNMDKADFMGRLHLIDDFTTFDNERFEVIRENSDGIEEVTSEELELMKDVKAIIIDENWFQVYDNNNKFTEKYVASGLYWNYFYHTWKTISNSPFSNAVVIVSDNVTIENPDSVTVLVSAIEESEEAVTMTLLPDYEKASVEPQNIIFTQTREATENLIGVQWYGALLIPNSAVATNLTLELTINGEKYTAGTQVNAKTAVGTEIVFSKASTLALKAKAVKVTK